MRHEASARAPLTTRDVHDAAHRGIEIETADFAAEGGGAQPRATLGVEYHGGAGEVAAFREGDEVARRVSGDITARRNPELAFGSARFGRALQPQFGMPWQRAFPEF